MNNIMQAAFKKANYEGHYPARCDGALDHNGNQAIGDIVKNVGGSMEYLHGVCAADNRSSKLTWRGRANNRPLAITRGPAKKTH